MLRTILLTAMLLSTTSCDPGEPGNGLPEIPSDADFLLKKIDLNADGSFHAHGLWSIDVADVTNKPQAKHDEATPDQTVEYTFDSLTEHEFFSGNYLQLTSPNVPSTISLKYSKGKLERLTSTWPRLQPGDIQRRKAHLMVFSVLAASGVLYESWDAYAETCKQARTVRSYLRQDYKHSHRRGRDGANETTEYGPLHETMRAPADRTRQDHLQPHGGPEPILEWKSLPSSPDFYVAHLYNTPEPSIHTTLFGVGSFPELSAVVIVVKPGSRPDGGFELEPMSPGVWVIIRNDKQEDVEEPIKDLLTGFGRHYKVKRELDSNQITYKRVTDDHSAVFKTWLWDLRVNGAVVARVRDDREVTEPPNEAGQRWTRTLDILYQDNKARERAGKALGLVPRKVMLAGQAVHKECLCVKPTEITVSFEDSQANETADSLLNATRRVVHLLASIGQLDSPRDIRRSASSKRKGNAFGNELHKLDCTVAAESDAGEKLEMALSDLLLPENGSDALAWERVVFSSRKEKDVFVSYLEHKDFCVRIQRVGRNSARGPLSLFSAVTRGIVEYIPQSDEGSSRYDKASDAVEMQLVRPSEAVLYDFLVSPYLE